MHPGKIGFVSAGFAPSLVAVDLATAPDPAPLFQRLHLHNLFNIAQWQDQISWEPFEEGVDIYRLYGDGRSGPSAALIRFRRTGKVPLHSHAGYEHIFVLAGSQHDQNSTAEAGALMINPPGTTHSVVSEAGCIVLAIYEKPAQFATGPLARRTKRPAPTVAPVPSAPRGGKSRSRRARV
jgi:quercetin dioxygenase-like cupin family protein